MRFTSILAAILVAVLVAVGCGGGGGGNADARDGDASGDTMVGRIDVEESELGGGIGTVASVYAAFEAPDGEPDLVNDGTCRVYEYPCLGSVGACAGVPGHSAGTIAITGLNAAVTLAPDPETHSYGSPSGLPDDLFADAATVTATAAGDEVGAFSLSVTAVEPLVSAYADATLGLVPGDPYDLTWTAGTSGARIQFRVNWADICHAGAEWYVMICEVDDTGAFTVPASITTHLPAGFGQCGARVARFRRATVPGRDVELTVASSDFFGFF